MVRSDHKTHCKKLIRSFEHYPKKFYGHMRRMKTVDISVNQLIKGENAELTSTDEEAAEVLCDFFQSVFTIEQGEPTVKVVNENISVQKPVIFDVNTVKNKLKKLKSDKSPGPDGLNPIILNRCADTLADPLISRMFQESLDTGRVPEDWRTANISPIFKKGSRKEPIVTIELCLSHQWIAK